MTTLTLPLTRRDIVIILAALEVATPPPDLPLPDGPALSPGRVTWPTPLLTVLVQALGALGAQRRAAGKPTMAIDLTRTLLRRKVLLARDPGPVLAASA